MKFKLLFLGLFFSTMQFFSQKDTIVGRIIAFGEFPLNKVKIEGNKLKNISYSDGSGKFKILGKNKETLTFSADGFFKQKIKVKLPLKKELKINLVFNEKKEINKRKAVTAGHISENILEFKLKESTEINKNNLIEGFTNVFEVIQYKYPAIKVIDVNGTNQVLVTTRGVNSLFSNIHALLTVNGVVVNDISNITPTEVKSVKILKGTSASSWGVRGSNGVVVIKTK